MQNHNSASQRPARGGYDHFNITQDERLPPLAWMLKHARGDAHVNVLAGADIRQADGMFWEGVNPCVDAPRKVIAHHFPLCSGALIDDGDLTVFSVGHTLDRVFVAERGAEVFIGNSLPFVLQASGLRLSPGCLTYHWHLGAIFAPEQNVPVDGGRLRIFHNVNLSIASDNSVSWAFKPKSPEFKDYAEYRTLLDAHIRDIAAAASHPINKNYAPVSMVSTGYDSPAVTALSKLAGTTTTLTITDARHGGSDSGAPIAEALGLNVETGTRAGYLAHGIEAERVFYVGAMANDIVFYPWLKRLNATLLFSGYKGDMMWDRNFLRGLGPWSWDTDGATMQEMRVRAGFVHFPAAFYGWQHADRVLEISRSAEMAPWTLGTDYDRPIARRIAEEAGVPRGAFGQKKKMVTSAVGVDKATYVGIDDLGLSQTFRDLLRQHRRTHGGLVLELNFWFNNSVHRLMRTAHGLAHALRRAITKAPTAGAAPAAPQPNAKPSLKQRLFFELEMQFPWRRKYMSPFTDLNFAAQVANELAGADYAPALADAFKPRKPAPPAANNPLASAML
ncbi:MAG TPA: hypothetical protein VM915_13430 [Verrucomicrobiae bacterium]|nr:hypothetical protein [Verrucomicrobiae bacterium]